jgi:hypothetical protein
MIMYDNQSIPSIEGDCAWIYAPCTSETPERELWHHRNEASPCQSELDENDPLISRGRGLFVISRLSAPRIEILLANGRARYVD